MIITSEITIEITFNNKKNYIKKYPNIKVGDNLLLKIEDLGRYSTKKVLVKCDKCDIEKIMKISSHNYNVDNNGIYICKKCVINSFSKKEIQEKIKKTNLEKYGVEYPLQNKDLLKKMKNTTLERYGVECSLKNNEIKEKMINTIKNRTIEQKEIIKEKIKNSNIEKYGNDFSKKRREIFENTMLEKYGVKNALENEDIIKKMKIKINNKTSEEKSKSIEKQKNTNLIKYGVEYINQNQKIKEKSRNTKRNNSIKNFVERYDNIYNVDYDKQIIFYNCPDHGIKEISSSLFYHRINMKNTLCPECNPTNIYSDTSNQLEKFIRENYYGNILINTRKIINPLELDIYIPELKLAFEFNGLFWHSEYYKENNYHLKKTEECEKQGIQLIHIYEDDWLYKQDIIKSMILNKLNKIKNKIYARKCIIKEVNNKESKLFLENNHIQGNVNAKYNIGLYYDNELVSLMTFGKLRKPMNSLSEDKIYEMIRFCNKLNMNIIGGASKLFSYFVKNYKPIEIISYADRSYSNGKLYKKLNFKLNSYTKPNYYYIINNQRKYRFNYRKDKLIKEGYDASKTEHQIMLNRGIYRIYNSGNYKFIWKN